MRHGRNEGSLFSSTVPSAPRAQIIQKFPSCSALERLFLFQNLECREGIHIHRNSPRFFPEASDLLESLFIFEKKKISAVRHASEGLTPAKLKMPHTLHGDLVVLPSTTVCES